MVINTILDMRMTTRYISSLPNWTYKLFIRDSEGNLNHAVLTGEDTKECHTRIAEYVRDNIGFETLDHITKKSLSEDYGSSNAVEISKNYLSGLLY